MVSSKTKQITLLGAGVVGIGSILAFSGSENKNSFGSGVGGDILSFVKTATGSDTTTTTTTTSTSPNLPSNTPLTDTKKSSNTVVLPSGSSILNSDGSKLYANDFVGPIGKNDTRAVFHTTPTGSSYNKDFVGPLNEGDSWTETKKASKSYLKNPLTSNIPKPTKSIYNWFK